MQTNIKITWLGLEFTPVELISYCSVAFVCGVLGYGIYVEENSTREAALKTYIANSKLQTRETANHVAGQFKQIYQGIRTLARLPAIRNIDRYDKNLEINARITAQEIYNNLAENVALSEVYIVHVDFDHDKIDPQTGKLEEPVVILDNLIVGRNADGEQAKKPIGSPAVSVAPEVERFEYRLMREQLSVLKKKFSTENKIKGLSYPAIAGREVITCDNTRYSPSKPNDSDRKGLIYSVPFYRKNGTIGGMISAVILTSVIKDMLQSSSAALQIKQYDYLAGARDSNLWAHHLGDINLGRPAADLLYSEIVDLPIADITGEWKIWAGLDNQFFWSRSDVASSESQAKLKYVSLFLATFAIIFFLRTNFSEQRRVQHRSDELERLVDERTSDLRIAREKSEAANKAKSTFLANMSHDIRTPISGIIGLADILTNSELGVDDAKKIRTIYQSGNILLDLINNVLDLSKIEAGYVDISREIFSPQALIYQCVSMFSFQAEKKGLNIEYGLSSDVPEHVEGDFKHLRQVLINLLGNAIKFTDKGNIIVRVSTADDLPGRNTQLRFEIEDTGIGIAASDLNTICEPFVQEEQSDGRSFGGTGLGLSISRGLIEKMGGKLGFESTKGIGTTFFFELPFIEQAVEDLFRNETSRSLHATSHASYKAQILIVEDNPVNLEIAKTYLEQLGCKIEVATNGKEAVDIQSRTKFDLIFMDCKMPELDGFEATRAIRKMERNSGIGPTPIVALTANAFKEDQEKCVNVGMNDFLPKPFAATELRDMLEKHLDSRNILVT